MPATTSPPPLLGPSSKEKKYDRQLRLWAANGQAALEKASVLLVNSGCGVVGVEALKNLVLPGIGHFTIIDANTVTEADLGVNFFLDEDSLGSSRAKKCSRLLEKLNPDGRGSYLHGSVDSYLEEDDFLDEFTLIILTAPLQRATLQKIISRARTLETPVIYVHSVGFYSHFAVTLPDSFPILETHPDQNSTVDLRLLSPWPDLLQLVDDKTSRLHSLTDHEHGHVPYVLLLLYYLQQWQSLHDEKPPITYQEKTEFRELVRKGMRSSSSEGAEENFEEAVAAVLKTLNPYSIQSSLKEIFNAEECKHHTKESPDFWIMAAAVAAFYMEDGVLPLPGSLPDMKAQSADYIALQNVYKDKARKDYKEVLSTVRLIEKTLDRDHQIDEREVGAFCKGAAHARLIRGRPFHVAYAGADHSFGEARATYAFQQLEDPDSCFHVYIAFLAYDFFVNEGLTTTGPDETIRQNAKILPGEDMSFYGNDTRNMKDYADEVVDTLRKEADKKDASFTPVVDKFKEKVGQVIEELVRAGGGELHCVSAFTGGLVAQEAIKIITRQYVPVDNTCVYDGIQGKTCTLKL